MLIIPYYITGMLKKKDIIPTLNDIQRRAVTYGDGPLLIAAGAGSGKTKTLTSRLIYLLEKGVSPEQIIAVTFTNKAANEMRSRILNSQLPITNYQLPFVGTFHSLGVQILKNQSQLAGRTSAFSIFDEDDSLSLIKSILANLNLPKEKFNPFAMAAKISQIKNEVRETAPAAGKFEKIIGLVFKDYEAALRRSNAFDFDDLIGKVVAIFQAYPEILRHYQDRWQHILVDEFQDVNTTQYLLIKLLAEKHKNLFVIGDDAQSIYAFRGSDFRNFLNFEKDWLNAAIIKLEENYRSTKNIIRAASELIKNNVCQKPKNLWTNNEAGSLIQLRAFSNNEEEAWAITEKIAEYLKKNESPSDVAILYRTNAQSRSIEQALIRSHISYEIYGGLKFYARKEIKDIIAGLRYAFNPNDEASIERIRKTFIRPIQTALLNELPRLAKELSIAELIKFFIENTDYIEYLEKHFKNPEERQENIKELIAFASTFPNAQDFLQQVTLMSSLDGRPKMQQNAVKLMTIHLAKGLEFKHVFIAGCNEGLLPHERSLARADDLEEERRLMYVAMTRAKQELQLSFYDLPSRFLGELPPELIEFKKVTGYGEETKDWDDEIIYIDNI